MEFQEISREYNQLNNCRTPKKATAFGPWNLSIVHVLGRLMVSFAFGLGLATGQEVQCSP